MKNEALSIKNCKRIAIMGGTFDPIHYGHLVTAEAVRQEMNVERVLFIPTGYPPHKEGKKVTNDEHRYLMTVLATVNNAFFDVSRIEIDRPGITYTIDTIKELRKICRKDAEIFFITGADAVNQILTWKNPEELLSLCSFVAVTRPEYNKDKFIKNIAVIENKFKSNVHILEVPALAISSTDIRNRVIANKTIKYLLPEEVEKYIFKFGLYSNSIENEASIDSINKRLHYILSPSRFEHTQKVAEEAVKLAKHYKEDENKTFLAGLLHDCAKEYSQEDTRRMCNEFNLKLDDIIEKQIDLAHGFLGAELAKNEYRVYNNDILNAIRYHTLGRKKMSKLEKIIYLADFIEPTRKDFGGLDKLRKVSYENLDKAMFIALKLTIDYNKQKNRIIHPLSLEALKYYKNIKEE